MKHMILSFEMKGDFTSDQFLMLWFQKDSLDTAGFRPFLAVQDSSIGDLVTESVRLLISATLVDTSRH